MPSRRPRSHSPMQGTAQRPRAHVDAVALLLRVACAPCVGANPSLGVASQSWHIARVDGRVAAVAVAAACERRARR
jgi:hypothetical protein